VEYREALYITEEKTREQVRKEVTGGLAMLWENAFQNPSITIVESRVEEEENKIWAISIFEQDCIEAMAALISELGGNVVAEDQELFARKMLPLLQRVDIGDTE